MQHSGDAELAMMMAAMATACKGITRAVRKAGIAGLNGLAGQENSSGDDVKKLDILSNDIMVSALLNSVRTPPHRPPHLDFQVFVLAELVARADERCRHAALLRGARLGGERGADHRGGVQGRAPLRRLRPARRLLKHRLVSDPSIHIAHLPRFFRDTMDTFLTG